MPTHNTITTTLTAASSYDLVALSDVHIELNIPADDTANDAYFSTAISRWSTAVQKYCKQKFVTETLQDAIFPIQDPYPWQTPNGVAPLQLSTYPVQSVSSVVVNLGDTSNLQTLTAGTDYVLDLDAGQLTRLNCWWQFPENWWAAPTTVQFVGGYASVPDDVAQATLRLITSAFQQRGRDPYLKRQNQARGVGEQEWWIPSTPQGNFTPDIAELLEQYRVPTVR